MQFQAALILEDGVNKGVFTAGILDFFQNHQLYLPYVAAISVGICNAMDYTSRQPGKTRSCMIPAERNVPPIHWCNLYRKGSVIDLDLVFGEYPNRLDPFDFAAFQNSETTCEFVVTNCRTGMAEYLSERKNKERMLAICRARCSMPYILPMEPVGEESYLDGGISDPLPVDHARLRGYEKVIVILKQRKGFLPHGLCCEPYLIRSMYRKYPALSEALGSRIERYKSRLSYIERLEKAGAIYAIRPEKVEAKALCMDERKLKRFYMQGYETAETNFAAVMDYLRK